MASRYPDLIPSQYEQEIQQSLTDLHELNYFSLSFPGRPQAAQGLVKAVQKRLDDPHNSDQYQTALEFKMAVVQNDKVAGMVASETAKNEEKARKLLAALTDRLAQPHEWIYGGKPTALDAHLVPFIARMIDVGRGNLIPEKLHEYSNWAMKREEWVKMMNGRKCTMIPVNEM